MSPGDRCDEIVRIIAEVLGDRRIPRGPENRIIKAPLPQALPEASTPHNVSCDTDQVLRLIDDALGEVPVGSTAGVVATEGLEAYTASLTRTLPHGPAAA